ncbi:exonuclease subunit SbcD [Sinorhizobium meliloti]|uniref:exonuclease SbcCD subunit D n=1 Tax=Sinorhizobium TaxID=28105 RepID=UPI000FD6D5FB|nr:MULTISPECIES: exonuclease SbcCD subunit D [Sinorhizobium]MDW9364876.1 exonuclease SbcCD subunit D [Sinorhizobium meliloti]MDW9387568.1 exonuclease subunit SbcD [Sinorhizobium meliloti]RVI97746.1 exonuclease SbcCD subunit D [Sinorhizobium medicae]RVP06373.1 exonuclease SbcCD subunit D [Sinorhizobium meliloti]
MKILHTADLHLGRQFNGLSLDDDHADVLNQIVEAIHRHCPDILLIAGDVFDRAAPPASAVRQFNAFLSRVAKETEAAVIIISGNHDSADRIEAMSIMPDRNRAMIRGAIAVDEHPFVLHDAHGPVAFSGLPFSYEYAARECFKDESLVSPEDVLKSQVAAARKHVPSDMRWVVIAHAFVTGARSSESERPLARVGGIETVSAEIFDGACYVALGHIHRPQIVGAQHIRYSGSPLAFGFDEADHDKSMCLVDLDGAGNVTVDQIAFRPTRKVRVLTGRHAELVAAERSGDLIKVVLTDETPIIEAMKRLRDVFPYACQLTYQRDERSPIGKSFIASQTSAIEPITLVGEFVEQVRTAPITEVERAIIGKTLHEIGSEGQAA